MASSAGKESDMANPEPTSGKNAMGGPGGGRSARGLWARAWAASAVSVAFGCVYFFARQHFKDGVWRFDLTLVDKSLGVAALFLVALSMALTGIVYFSKGPVRLLSARKYYGLVGFWTGLAHGAVNHILLPALGLHAEGGAEDPYAEAAALAALALFALMAVASNTRAAAKLGPGRWRRFLRYAGYAGLVLAAGHAAFLKWGSWTKYLKTFGSVLPSLSLPVVLFAAIVVLLRLAVWISRGRKRS
jgi:DMSO/TMAO reductase YedYZ heme-binding membrane subunit